MAQRVVKLKPDKPAPGPAIRLRRGKKGFGFIVAALNEEGTECFLSSSEHPDYDSALKEAKDRAHRVRLPVQDDTGVEPETKAEKPITAKRQAAAPPSTPVDAPATLGDLPTLASNFALPAIDERLGRLGDVLEQRSVAIFNDSVAASRKVHSHVYGDSRSNAVAFTQKEHDLTQLQFQCVYGHMLAVQSALYAFLEKAFARIDELEAKCLTVDAFDAQVAEDDRTIELGFGSGEKRKVASFKWPVVIYRGTHKAGQQYQAGDMVTHEGSGWIAQRSTSAKPGTPNSGFQLAIKRGRDGKDGNP